MKKTERENMLLFSKERVAGLHRYRLYFTPMSSLKDETPRVFRLLVRLPFAFDRYELGRIYTLQYSGIYILKSEPKETFNLQEEDYTRLLHIRDVKFMDKRTSAALRATEPPVFSKDRYYSFEETRDIVNYRPDFLTEFAISAFSWILIGIGLLLPLGLYVWMLVLLGKAANAASGFSPDALALPLMGLGALPATMFLMTLLFTLAELALLRIDFTRWHILKRYTLAWGGIRRSIYLEHGDIRYLKKFGIIAGIVLAVFILICIII
jgi:hypothetical protein